MQRLLSVVHSGTAGDEPLDEPSEPSCELLKGFTVRGRSIHDLTEDYLQAERLAPNLALGDAVRHRLTAYHRFVERNGHRLQPFPAALREVALAEPTDSPVRTDVLSEGVGRRWPGRPWYERLRPPATDSNPALRRTILM